LYGAGSGPASAEDHSADDHSPDAHSVPVAVAGWATWEEAPEETRRGPPTRSVTIALTVAAELTDDPSSDRMASTADSGATPEPATVGSRSSSSSSLRAGPGRPSVGSYRSEPSGSGSGHAPVSS